MTAYNDVIWVQPNDDGTATITTGKAAPTGAKQVVGPPATIKDMAHRIAGSNGNSLDFPCVEEAGAALDGEEIVRLAGIRP